MRAFFLVISFLVLAIVLGLASGGHGVSTPTPTPTATPTPIQTPVASLTQANLWVDQDGGDCTRSQTVSDYVDSSSCPSLDSAYQQAHSGDLILIRGGSYGPQDIQGNGGIDSDVTIAPVDGENVTLAGLDFFGSQHVHVEDLKAQWYIHPGSSYVTLSHVDGAWYAVRGSSHVTIDGGDVGPWENDTAQVTDSSDVTFDGVSFHDFVKTQDGAHTDCLGIFGTVTNMVVSRSTFTNCYHYDVLVDKSVTGTPPDHITFENDIFQPPGGNGYYAVGLNDCVHCTVRYSDLLGALSIPPDGFSEESDIYANIISNINTANCDSRPGSSFSYNLYMHGDTCGGVHEQTGDPLFTSVTDLHPQAGSPVAGAGDSARFPAIDFDGAVRQSPPDVGAFSVSR